MSQMANTTFAWLAAWTTRNCVPQLDRSRPLTCSRPVSFLITDKNTSGRAGQEYVGGKTPRVRRPRVIGRIAPETGL